MQVSGAAQVALMAAAGTAVVGTGVLAQRLTADQPILAIPGLLGGIAVTGLGVQSLAMGARGMGATMALTGAAAVLGAGSGLASALRDAADGTLELAPGGLLDRTTIDARTTSAG